MVICRFLAYPLFRWLIILVFLVVRLLMLLGAPLLRLCRRLTWRSLITRVLFLTRRVVYLVTRRPCNIKVFARWSLKSRLFSRYRPNVRLWFLVLFILRSWDLKVMMRLLFLLLREIRLAIIYRHRLAIEMSLSRRTIMLLRRIWVTILKIRSTRCCSLLLINIKLSLYNTWTRWYLEVKLLITPLARLVQVMVPWLSGLINLAFLMVPVSMLTKLVVKKVNYRGLTLIRLNLTVKLMYRHEMLTQVLTLRTRYLVLRMRYRLMFRLRSPNLDSVLRAAHRKFLTLGLRYLIYLESVSS